MVACDMSMPADVELSHRLKAYGGKWDEKVFYDEGEGDRQFGVLRMIVVPLDLPLLQDAI